MLERVWRLLRDPEVELEALELGYRVKWRILDTKTTALLIAQSGGDISGADLARADQAKHAHKSTGYVCCKGDAERNCQGHAGHFVLHRLFRWIKFHSARSEKSCGYADILLNYF